VEEEEGDLEEEGDFEEGEDDAFQDEDNDFDELRTLKGKTRVWGARWL